jgi:hypothetical protein
MLLNIIALCFVLVSILLVCAWLAGARTTGTTTTTAPVRPAPAAKDQRPLWAREELQDIPAAAPLDPWQERMDRFYREQERRTEALRRSLEIEAAQAEARARHQAQCARDRAFDREWALAQRPASFHGKKNWWVGPHGTPHRLKAKGRNSA